MPKELIAAASPTQLASNEDAMFARVEGLAAQHSCRAIFIMVARRLLSCLHGLLPVLL
jgi:hypothetical protein